jgi:hypothetical protein
LDLTDPTRVERKKMGKYERDVIISYSHLLSRLFKSLLYSRENMSSRIELKSVARWYKYMYTHSTYSIGV